MKIKLVVATRETEENFFTSTAIGKSISYNSPSFLDVRIFPNNRKGLPILYNQAIRECANDPCIICFAHDDLHLLDYFWFFRVFDSLANFDIVGIVGNKRRLPKQPSWAFVNDKFEWDKPKYLSGVIGHGNKFPPTLDVHGLPRQRVFLLDGLFLAAKSSTFIEHELFFDERFDFHFYDLDFCRQCEEKGLACGTSDLSVMHESSGNFGSEAWRLAYKTYLDKWGA